LLCDITIYLSWSLSCATQLLFSYLARDPFLSLLLLHIVLLLIAVGLKILFFLLGSSGVPLRSISLDNLQNWAGAGTFKPSSPIMKPVPKRLRTLLCCEPTLPSAGTLPARSLLNDLVRLRGAIITSCICGATKELQ
jgi:hypothetical protein